MGHIMFSVNNTIFCMVWWKIFISKCNSYKTYIFLWLIAALEFIVLIPGIGASAEILGYSESFLAIIFHAFQLGIFFILNKYTLKAEFNNYHMFAFILMGLSIIIISYTK
jgi:hypothetical protein